MNDEQEKLKEAEELNSLANMYMVQHRYANAETVLHQVLAIYHQVSMAGSYDYIDASKKLMAAYRKQGKL
jgi:hypothetical protein